MLRNPNIALLMLSFLVSGILVILKIEFLSCPVLGGLVICFAGCSIFWLSKKLQSEVALSTTEAEYIALSHSLRNVIPLLNILVELQHVFTFATSQALLSCSLFEDNSGATDHKTRPCTKIIGLKYHHVCSHVTSGLIKLFPISTFDQMADIFTKPLPSVTFIYLRKKLMGS
jgi:hypothetical protein